VTSVQDHGVATINGVDRDSVLPGRRPLGCTGRDVSEVGFGCASWWAHPRFPEAQAVALVHRSLEHGISVFDTGPSYADGEGERRLGKALRQRDRDHLLLITKAGTERRGRRLVKDFRPAAICASVERSRARLDCDRLPALLLHGCPAEQIDSALLDGLAELRASGKVDLIGLNSFNESDLRYAAAEPLFDILMLDFNVLRPERAALIDACAESGKAVIAAAGLGRALYTLDWRHIRGPRELWYWLRALGPSRGDWQQARRLRQTLDVPDWSPAALSLRWALRHPKLSCVLFNTTRLEHLEQNLHSLRRPLPSQWNALCAALEPAA
jgi:aryl-alcohol dehydrogenase-like predicted oxidoreductase